MTALVLAISCLCFQKESLVSSLPKVLKSRAVAYVERHFTYFSDNGSDLDFVDPNAANVLTLSLPDRTWLFNMKISRDRKYIASSELELGKEKSESFVAICDSNGPVFRTQTAGRLGIRWAGNSLLILEKDLPTRIAFKDQNSVWRIQDYDDREIPGSEISPNVIKLLPDTSMYSLGTGGYHCHVVMPEIGAVLEYSEWFANVIWTKDGKTLPLHASREDFKLGQFGHLYPLVWVPAERVLITQDRSKFPPGLRLVWPETKAAKVIPPPETMVRSFSLIGDNRLGVIIGAVQKDGHNSPQRLYTFDASTCKFSFIGDILWQKDSAWEIKSLL